MINTSKRSLRTAIFHGPSGSGKDTQLDLLEDSYSYERIVASSIMKSLKKESHPLALQADEYGKQGKLYPDTVVYGMLEEWIDTRVSPEKPWFFVSPVRKVTQIQLFDKLLQKFDRELDLFVHFKLSEETAIERMSLRTYCEKCGTTYHSKYKIEKDPGHCDLDGNVLSKRDDDNPEAIKKRLAWYNDDLRPILDEYRSRGILLEIDASPSIEEIHQTLMDELKNYG